MHGIAASTSGLPAHVSPSLDDPSLYINRELSWLQFNDRVLAQTTDASHPLLDRVRFLSIVATNLDEFFMIRVSALQKKLRSKAKDTTPDGLSTSEQLALVRDRAADMLERQAAIWERTLRPALAEHGIALVDRADYTPAVSAYLHAHFAREIWPVLTPLAFDPGHPFPFISNLSKNLAVVVKHGRRTKFARVKLPDALPRFIALPAALTGGMTTFAWLEDVVCENVQLLFPGAQVKSAHVFRVVRDADIVIQEDEADDLLESIGESVRQRRRGLLAMLQVESAMPKRVLEILVENFEIGDDLVLRTDHRLGFGDWSQLANLPCPELKYPVLVPAPVWPPQAADRVFDEIRHGDKLVHHPFQSFDAVETFLRAAVDDPNVICIKMTLYRIGANSPLVDLLLEAADAGKQVAVLVELKARFDERNNIVWAERLEEAGIHVVYGLLNLKTHCKLCLVVRRDSDGIRRYAHLATGNYNATTARVYTDLGLFTSRAAIVEDVSELFNHLTGYTSQQEYRELLVAPDSLRHGVIDLIEHETALAREGKPAQIIIKANAIIDHQMVRALYEASQAGVTIDLIVRGICGLRPGVEGVSDRITVRSIVGRFLEHSRVFWFGNNGQPRVYIGSADLMERNLDRRVEVLCPIHDRRHAEYLRAVVLDTYRRDTRNAWRLAADGTYTRVAGSTDDAPIDAQEVLLDWHARGHTSRIDPVDWDIDDSTW